MTEAKKIVRDHFHETDCKNDELLCKLTNYLQKKQDYLNQLVVENSDNYKDSIEHRPPLFSAEDCNVSEFEKGSDSKTSDVEEESNAAVSPSYVKNPSLTKSDHHSDVGKRSDVSSSSSGLNDATKHGGICEDTVSHNGNVSIKLSAHDGRCQVVKVKRNTMLCDLKELIQKTFQIPSDKQVLKQGFPPKVISESDGVAFDFAAGDHIRVYEVHAESGDQLTTSGNSKKKNEEENLTEGSPSGSLPEAKQQLQVNLELLKKDFEASNSRTMWEYALSKPDLFLPGGVFYQQFKHDIGLVHGRHCSLPLIPEHNFCYNEHFDRIEVCLKSDHHQISGDNTELHKELGQTHVMRQFALRTAEAPQSQPSELNETGSIVNSIRCQPVKVAPGYRTLGQVPNDLTEEEKSRQRKSLLKMIQTFESGKPDKPQD